MRTRARTSTRRARTAAASSLRAGGWTPPSSCRSRVAWGRSTAAASRVVEAKYVEFLYRDLIAFSIFLSGTFLQKPGICLLYMWNFSYLYSTMCRGCDPGYPKVGNFTAYCPGRLRCHGDTVHLTLFTRALFIRHMRCPGNPTYEMSW